MKKKIGRKRKHPDSNSLSKQKQNSKNESNSSLPTQKELNILSKDKKKLEAIQKIINPTINYDKVKIHSQTFSIGDNLLIFSSNENLIGELIKIIPNNGIKEYPFWPCIQVKWYYKKSDINRKKNNLLDERNFNSISEYELFSTNHKDIVFIETILMKVNIYSYDEYDSMEEHNDYTFFTRAKYDPGNEVLIPRFNDWKKGCVCQKPLNPDQLYIKCDECNGWFHPNCCGILLQDIEKINKFFCPFCKKKLNLN